MHKRSSQTYNEFDDKFIKKPRQHVTDLVLARLNVLGSRVSFSTLSLWYLRNTLVSP